MMETTGQTPPTEAAPALDLGTAVQRVLEASAEPLTLTKIRSRLPAPFRNASLEELADHLNRQVAANVLFRYPKYRSQQDRYWDRPMSVHVAALLRLTLREGPLPWSELRRRLPAYAMGYAEEVLADQVARGLLHRHPRMGKRGPERFGSSQADPKTYLRPELATIFHKLENLGFSESRLRSAALEILHEEEWSPGSLQPPRASSSPASSLGEHDLESLDQAELHPDSPDALDDGP